MFLVVIVFWNFILLRKKFLGLSSDEVLWWVGFIGWFLDRLVWRFVGMLCLRVECELEYWWLWSSVF